MLVMVLVVGMKIGVVKGPVVVMYDWWWTGGVCEIPGLLCLCGCEAFQSGV